MSRTNVDIDDEACAQVMRMYHLDSKREAINLALRKLAVVPMTKAEAMAMRGFWKDRPLDDPIVLDDDALHHWRADADC
jgi:Arc/MetJ family transcription regulator